MSGLKQAAEKVRAARHKKWLNAWDEWELTTFADHIISKLKRADNCPAELNECLIDAYNYAMELRRRLSGDELKITDHLIIKLEQIWGHRRGLSPISPMRIHNELDVALFRAVELKRRLLGGRA